ncbi:MAG: sugar phosphate isomerase/epimerase, partial [Spirochaetota bacterium]
MRFLFFCPYWGSEKMGMADFCMAAKDSGYDGIELALPRDDPARTETILKEAQAQSLGVIAQQWEARGPDLAKLEVEFRSRLEWLASAKPLFINSH